MRYFQKKIVSVAIYLVFIIGYAADLISMEPFSAQKHHDWLCTINNEAVTDARTLVSSMCGLSDYLGYYKGCNEFRNKTFALNRLHETRSVLKKLASNIDKLSSDQYESLPAWLRLTPTVIPVGNSLSKAFNDLDFQCIQLRNAIRSGEVENAVTIMQLVSHNTQLLFSALHGDKTLSSFIRTNNCQDNGFVRAMREINTTLYSAQTMELVKKAREQKKRERSLAEFLKKSSTGITIGLKATQEIAKKPDLAGIASMFLNPSRSMKVGLPLIEKFTWLRKCLGSKGVDIQMAMDNNMAPTKLMRIAQEVVPAQLMPLLIPLLRDYGKTVVNPLVWAIAQGLLPVYYLVPKIDEYVEHAQKPVLEDQLFPYLDELGLCFHDMVQSELSCHNQSKVIAENRENQKKSFMTLMEENSALLKEFRDISKEMKAKKLGLDLLDKMCEKIMNDPRYLETQHKYNFMLKENVTDFGERSKELLGEYESIIVGFEGRLHVLQKKRTEVSVGYNDLDSRLKQLTVQIDDYDKVLTQKAEQKKERIKLRQVHLSVYFSTLVVNFKNVSDETINYYYELVKTKKKEFSKVLKKYHKKTGSLDSEDVQDLFNAWFSYLLDREQAPFKLILKENKAVLDQINQEKNRSQIELEEAKNKTIKDVWGSYGFKAKCVAWLYVLKDWRFPIFTDRHKKTFESYKSLFEHCLAQDRCLEQQAPYKYIRPTLQNEQLQQERKKLRTIYTHIKLMLEEHAVDCADLLKDLDPMQPLYGDVVKRGDIGVKHIPVQQQKAAECGYHALFNALCAAGKLPDSFDTVEKFIQALKQRVVKMRDGEGVQWLKETEIISLLDQLQQHNSILVIPDLKRYLKGWQGLGLTVVNQIAKVHKDLAAGIDFERVYILGTMEESTRNLSGHWIALKQTAKDGKVSYKVMNSLDDCSCDLLVNKFIKLMHKKRGYRELSPEDAELLKSLVKDIEFSEIFRRGSYALQVMPRDTDTEIVINANYPQLIDRILNASVQLLKHTQGQPFHNCMGHVRPIEMVKEAVKAIKSRDGSSILMKNFSDDVGMPIAVKVTEQQHKILNDLSAAVGID